MSHSFAPHEREILHRTIRSDEEVGSRENNLNELGNFVASEDVKNQKE